MKKIKVARHVVAVAAVVGCRSVIVWCERKNELSKPQGKRREVYSEWEAGVAECFSYLTNVLKATGG